MANLPSLDQPDQPLRPATGPSVWRGAELAASGADDGPTAVLAPGDVRELHVALRVAQRRGVPLLKLTEADFPLPHASAGLRRVVQELEHGGGFVVLKGLPVKRLNPTAVRTLFWGVGRHLGVPVSQNAEGHMLGHVRDTGGSLADPATRGYQTREALPFHTDPADTLALLHLTAPRSGGRTSLVSSGAVHNAVLKRRPDLAARLFRTYCLDRREEHSPGERPWDALPLALWHDGRLSVRYHRLLLESSQRFPEVPSLTHADIELFDLIDEVAASDEFRLDLELGEGDLLLVNNHAVMHRREAYQDFEDQQLKRHLLRLWLTPHTRRELPASFWGTPAQPSGGRGGIAPRDVVASGRGPLRITMSGT